MFLIFALSLVLLNAPLIPHLSSKEGRLRFEEVTWLNDLDLVKESNAQIAKSGNTALANIIYNRRVYYGREFVKHYLDHYSSKFLFMSGDVNPRLSTQAMGELYLWDGALFVLGLFFLIRFRSKMTAIIIFWFLTSPIPASVARETPHALRILNILPMPQIIIALGLGELVTVFRNKTLFKIFLGVAVGILYGFSFFNYIANYYLIYSVKYADSWQFGYKQLVKYLSTVENEYDHIHVTNLYGRPYIYFLFYKQYPLQKYLAKRNASIDEFGFWSIKSFGKYDFSDNSTTIGKWLYVEGPTGNLLDPQLQHVVTGPEGKVIFEISKSK